MSVFWVFTQFTEAQNRKGTDSRLRDGPQDQIVCFLNIVQTASEQCLKKQTIWSWRSSLTWLTCMSWLASKYSKKLKRLEKLKLPPRRERGSTRPLDASWSWAGLRHLENLCFRPSYRDIFFANFMIYLYIMPRKGFGDPLLPPRKSTKLFYYLIMNFHC